MRLRAAPPGRCITAALACALLASRARPLSDTGLAAVSQRLSARQAGMGGLSFAGGDALSGWTNPANLALQPEEYNFELATASVFGGEQTIGSFVASQRFEDRVTLGASVSGFSTAFPMIDGTGNDMGWTIDQEVVVGGLTVASRLGPGVEAGATLRFGGAGFYTSKSYFVAGDFGIRTEWEGLLAGLSARNIGGSPQGYGTVAQGNVPAEFRFGGGARFGPWNTTAGAELSAQPNRNFEAGLGLETWPLPVFGLRTGVLGASEEQRSYTVGLTVAWHGASFDASFGSHALGVETLLAASFGFGPRKHEPKPAENGDR